MERVLTPRRPKPSYLWFDNSSEPPLMNSSTVICIRFRSAPFGAVPAQLAREENTH
jgi:hypothetical protein